MAKKTIFRKTATERLSSPEQLDKLLVVISPQVWIGLVCILVLLTAVIFWLAFATIPVQVTFKGIVANPAGLIAVHPNSSGSIATIKVEKGEEVKQSDVLFTLSTASKAESSPTATVVSPVSGEIDRLETNLGDVVSPSSTLVIIQQSLKQGEHPQVYTYIPLEYINRIVPGMEADVNIITFDPKVRNSFQGKVVKISPFAVSKPEILQRFGHLNSMTYFAPENTPLLELQIDPEDAKELTAGQFCTIRITLTRKKPLEYLFL